MHCAETVRPSEKLSEGANRKPGSTNELISRVAVSSSVSVSSSDCIVAAASLQKNIVIMGNAQSSDLTIRYIYNLSKADRIAKVLQEVLSGT